MYLAEEMKALNGKMAEKEFVQLGFCGSNKAPAFVMLVRIPTGLWILGTTEITILSE